MSRVGKNPISLPKGVEVSVGLSKSSSRVRWARSSFKAESGGESRS
jgi:ribosomal protein L6P/L9E